MLRSWIQNEQRYYISLRSKITSHSESKDNRNNALLTNDAHCLRGKYHEREIVRRAASPLNQRSIAEIDVAACARGIAFLESQVS